MLKTFSLCLALFCASAQVGSAQDWAFYYGPDFGATAKESYAQLNSGPHVLQVHPYGDRGAIALSTTLDGFETVGQVPDRLQSAPTVTLTVIGPVPRYSRDIPSDQYIWEHRAGQNNTLIAFLLTGDDMDALIDGDAVFINFDGLQFRFGSSGARAALGRLINTLIDAHN
ncbi:MAG: hypothetical protein JJ868_15645 [Shimia sp.]|uniref:hypothetical protein n=1 Tax=Shimia sp. TaxID=1954381 RepID=UPI001B11C653|nr:hypothetical protein [Shimia sp.]MBO6898807.1 hypothetical protein [Shimia sp.]